MNKPGTILHECSVEDGTGKITWDEWHVRTVRGGKVYAILKASFTWGKLSKKTGDFGWLDPIPPWCRCSKRIDAEWDGIATTKKKAIKLQISYTKRHGDDEDYQGITVAEIIRKLETLYKRQR